MNNLKKEVYVILDNIRSTHNVGSIFRTADAAGISKVYICGFTPSPLDKFKRERKDIAKVALGAEKTILWEYYESINSLIDKLKKDGVFIVAIEQSENSVDYKKVEIKYPIAFLIGNEVNGISKEVLDRCDVVSEISMKGEKESLNVSVSFGIAIFRMLDI